MGHGDSQRISAELALLFRNAAGVADEMRASIARYACVLASSYLEAAFREMGLAYARLRADPTVVRYVESSFGAFRDPNMEKVLQFLGRFDPDFRDRLEVRTDSKSKDSIDSISANRNNIAHGRGSAVSLGQIAAYYEDAQRVVAAARAILGV